MRSKCICTKSVLHHLEECSDVSKCNSLSEKLFSFRHGSEARAEMFLQFSKIPKIGFPHVFAHHAKALSPTAHCKLKVFGWFCAYTCMQTAANYLPPSARNQIRPCRETHHGCPILPRHPDSSPQSHDACEHRLRRSSNLV